MASRSEASIHHKVLPLQIVALLSHAKLLAPSHYSILEEEIIKGIRPEILIEKFSEASAFGSSNDVRIKLNILGNTIEFLVQIDKMRYTVDGIDHEELTPTMKNESANILDIGNYSLIYSFYQFYLIDENYFANIVISPIVVTKMLNALYEEVSKSNSISRGDALCAIKTFMNVCNRTE